MKKSLSLLIAALFLISTFTLAATSTVGAAKETMPDWIITEVGADTNGREGNENGYGPDVSKDCFEFIELYNSSGRELNLYDYALTYCSGDRDTEQFENAIQRYTPIKPGDYLDDSNLVPNTGIIGSLENKPVNPDACTVAPGEVVVLWVMYYEAYANIFNGGKGMSVADFRAHWNIPEDVKVIAVDGNGNATNGGNPKNFNVINSGVGTYGITLQSEELEQTANAPDGVYQGSYVDSKDLAFWAALDYKNVILYSDLANLTINFTWDFSGYAIADASVTDVALDEYTYDTRRGYVLSVGDQPTPGSLNVLQKMTLGVPLVKGESYELLDEYIYWPILGEKMLGFKINGKLVEYNATFAAPEDGVYTFDFFFEKDLVEETTPETTEEPTTEEPTTEAPTAPESGTEQRTTTAPEQDKGGCGSALAFCWVALALVPMAVLAKKRR